MKVPMFFAAGLIGFCTAAASAQLDEWKLVGSKDGVDVYYRATNNTSHKTQVATIKVRNNSKKAYDVVVEILLDFPPAKPGDLIPPVDIRRRAYLQVKARSEEISDVTLDGMITGRVRLYCVAKVGAREKCEISSYWKPKQ